VSGSGLKIERADGQAFTVKPLASATIGGSSITSSDYSFTDNASTPNTLSNSGSTASGASSVSGSGAQVTLADFSAAGVTTVTSSNIEAVVQSLVAKNASSEIDTAKEISAVPAAMAAVAVITAYAEADGTGTAPTADDFAAIGVTTYDSTGTSTAIDASNIDAIKELLKETSVGTQGADTYTLTDAVSIQSMLDTASIVERLDAIAKIAAYADDSNQPTPAVADYAALGITVASGDLATANGNIAAQIGSATNTIAEIYPLVPTSPVVQLTRFNVASGETTVLNVGDSIAIETATSVPLDLNSAGAVQAVLSNGALVTLRPYSNSNLNAVTLRGTYTVQAGDTTTSDLDLSSLQALSGESLPKSANGTVMELIIPAGVPSLASRYDVQVTDYAPPRIEDFFLDSDTGLFANDLVTSAAYQSNTTNGAITGSFSPALDAPDKFVAISNNFDGATVYDANGSLKNTLSALDNGSTGLYSDPALGQWLADQSGVEVVYTDGSTALTDGTTYTFTFTTSTGDQTLSYTASTSNTLINLIDAIFQNQGWADAGYLVTNRYPGYSVERTDGEGFTITLSQNLIDLGKVSTREFGPSGQQDTLITSAINVTNGATDLTGAFRTKVKQGTLATLNQNGDGTSTAEVQTVDLLGSARGSMRTFFGDLRFGSVIVELAVGFESSATQQQVNTVIQNAIDRVFGNSNPDRPTVSVGSFGTPDGNGELLVDLTFTWNHNNNANVDYLVLVDDDRATTLVDQTFDITLDQTAAHTPVLSGASANALTAAEGSSIDISGVETGEYLYFIEATAYQGLTSVDTNADQHMQDIFALSTEKWTRVLVGENVTTTDTVSFTVDGLMDGSYKLVAMDLAGNFSAVSSDTLTVTGSTSVNTDLDVALNSISDTTDGDGSTVELLLDINEAVAGDTVEIWIDGVIIDEHELTATEIGAGSASVAIDVDANGADTGTLNDVNVQIAVRHGSFVTQSETEDATVNYTWS